MTATQWNGVEISTLFSDRGKLLAFIGSRFVEGAYPHLTGPATGTRKPTFQSRAGEKAWLVGELLHREDGPAFIGRLRSEWWVNGKRHREDGPAVTYSDGASEWWWQGEQAHNLQDWIRLFGSTGLPIVAAVQFMSPQEAAWHQHGASERFIVHPGWKNPKLESGERILSLGAENGRLMALLHDGSRLQERYLAGQAFPTVQQNFSSEEGHHAWLVGELLHRVDGPAFVDSTREEWWRNGKLHRVDGPAMTVLDEDWCPCYFWMVDGLLHREDGPAVIHSDGVEEWWYQGRHIESLDEFQLVLGDSRLQGSVVSNMEPEA